MRKSQSFKYSERPVGESSSMSWWGGHIFQLFLFEVRHLSEEVGKIRRIRKVLSKKKVIAKKNRPLCWTILRESHQVCSLGFSMGDAEALEGRRKIK